MSQICIYKVGYVVRMISANTTELVLWMYVYNKWIALR
jgi:hypothetical protein